MSTYVKSSFKSRSERSGQSNHTNDANAIPNMPVSADEDEDDEESTLLVSQNNSIRSNFTENNLDMNSLKNSFQINGDYISDSYEPNTPDGNSINFQTSKNNNPISGQPPIMQYATDNDDHSLSNEFNELSFNDLTDVPIISKYSTLPLDNYEEFEPTLENTTLLNSHSYISQPFDTSIKQRSLNNDPLSYLVSQEQNIETQLQKNVDSHYDISKKGLSSKKIRRNILNCLDTKRNVYDAIIEIYNVELNRKKLILKAFKGWEHNKLLLNHKIEEIRTSESGKGLRLNQLLDESRSVDNEMQQLENRLLQLKDKKKVLKNEITQSQSIIESRASSYIETLQDLQKEENDAIVAISKEKTIESGLSNMIENDDFTNQSIFSMKYYLGKFAPKLPDAGKISIDSSQIIEVVARQSESFKDHIDDYSKKRENMNQGSIIWQDITNDLNLLEDNISNLLNQQSKTKGLSVETSSKALELLTKSVDHLTERRISLKQMDHVLRKLVENEISILKQGIHMIDPNATSPNTSSMSDLKDHTDASNNHKLAHTLDSSGFDNKSIPKINVPGKAIGHSTVDTIPAIRSGSFSSTPGSFKSQLKSEFLGQNRAVGSKLKDKGSKKD
ncbi:hypothetical protein BN7_3084 [Wickerhamomyces ciferrii]|uniref:Uncharacterized protein n=1 Tax=Wickerhamomyces ciferrii (strain ATCC 14091 / BCRC 22168 / CBS 111 / JCM 3599 / NBRC 0793 / NRRL Y-1031 F-60-10) TaxID=1206466 RepID=K0KMT8_WICCF|nr:uncharacterized protein BN7_3084 [Wickerhamomyces ciferrii]CCH43532.1 hypothetical protein BN7_3084 [Wickerhamomyces ciferrii]